MADNNVVNYKEQGGARDVIGGSLDVISGGELDIESGAAFKLAGTQVTASAAELNAMDGVTATSTQINRTAVTTAGVVEASKVVVVGASKDVDVLRIDTPLIGATTITVTGTQINKLVQGAAAGAVITGGVVAFTGSTIINTALATVVSKQATQVSDPSVTNGMHVTVVDGSTAGYIIVKSWKPTAANDVEPIEGTASVTASWFALGT